MFQLWTKRKNHDVQLYAETDMEWAHQNSVILKYNVHVIERICVDNSWRTRNRVKIKHDSLSWYFLHVYIAPIFFTLIRVISLWLLIFFLSVSMSDNSTLIDKLTDSSTILFFDHLTLNLKNQCSSNFCLFLVCSGFFNNWNSNKLNKSKYIIL